MSESLRFSLEFSVIGLVIVFASLTIITLAISLIRRADSGWKKREKALSEAAVSREQNIDTITLLIISAAAATMVTGRFHIRKVRRLMRDDSHRSPWSLQGRAVLHGSHVLPKGRNR